MVSQQTVPFFIVVLTIGLAFGQYSEKSLDEVCKIGLVDAATRTADGSTYLFTNNYCLKTVNGGVAYGYPRMISDDWPGVGNGNIDAALTWDDGSTFIFKGDQYWRFFNKRPEEGYPKKIIEGFHGIPNNLDAALLWSNNSKTYFFKGDKYWRYDPQAIYPVGKDYPMDITAWIGVPNNVTAAINWEGGLTYFFKGANYWKYDNKEEKVPSGYPRGTSEGWLECSKNLREPMNNYEREKPERKEGKCPDTYKRNEPLESLLVEIYRKEYDVNNEV